MSETPKCEICGRPFDSTAGNLSEDVCWREVVPPGDGDYWDEDDAHRCYRLGYERARAALSAAEKREARLREALAKYWTGCRKCASWLGTDGPVTPAGSWFRGCDACRELREAYRATKAALEGASAASDPRVPQILPPSCPARRRVRSERVG